MRAGRTSSTPWSGPGLQTVARLSPRFHPRLRQQEDRDAVTAGPSIVALREVSKSYPSSTIALDRLSLDVGAGELLSLLGPSGCGKSTLLPLIAGLGEPSAGRIEWMDPPAPHRLGFVFQEPTLMPWARVADNIRLPLML